MCEFFSFNSIDGKFYYFKPEDIKKIEEEGNLEKYNFNSHTSIASYFKFNEDKSNKYEYNPFSKEFKIDQINRSDDSKQAEEFVKKIFDLDRKEFLEFCKNYRYKIDYKKLEEDFKDIPTKDDVIKELKRIERIDWFKPQKEPDKKKMGLKVKAILNAFKCNVGFEFEYHTLIKQKDWASAWASARASAWDSAWASAKNSARASARASAWASARASAWDSAWDSAWASARASAWDPAWASTWDSVFEVVKDLMKKKGYNENPFKLLVDLWEMGLFPVGVLKDKKFHIYYVPLEKNKEKNGTNL